MEAVTQIPACRNCGRAVADRYCPGCGQERIEGRLTVRRAAAEGLGNLLGGEHGFVFTLLQLSRRPGAALREYVAGRRRPYTGPFKYLAVWAAVVVLLLSWIDLDAYAPPREMLSAAQVARLGMPPELPAWLHEFNVLVRRFANVTYLLSLPLLAAITRLVFRRAGYNYAEHLVFNAYVTAQGSLVLVGTLLAFLPWLSASTYVAFLVTEIALGGVYFTWAAIGFFRTSVLGGVLRSLVTGVLGFVAGQLLLLLVLAAFLAWRIGVSG